MLPLVYVFLFIPSILDLFKWVACAADEGHGMPCPYMCWEGDLGGWVAPALLIGA